MATQRTAPQPPVEQQEIKLGRPIINVTEASKTIDVLLRTCYLITKQDVHTLEHIKPAALRAAVKFGMESPITVHNTRLENLAARFPLRVHGPRSRAFVFNSHSSESILESCRVLCIHSSPAGGRHQRLHIDQKKLERRDLVRRTTCQGQRTRYPKGVAPGREWLGLPQTAQTLSSATPGLSYCACRTFMFKIWVAVSGRQ